MSSKQNQKTGKKALTSSKRKAAEALSQATKKAHTGTSDTSHAARPDNHPIPSACVAVEGGRGNATTHCNDAAIEVMEAQVWQQREVEAMLPCTVMMLPSRFQMALFTVSMILRPLMQN